MNYKENIISLIKEYARQIGIDFNLIKRINITVYDDANEWEAEVKTITTADNLYFELFIQQHLLNNLASENADTVKILQNIIQHELYHCKEMSITALHTNWRELYFHPPIATTKLLLLDTAFNQWSEYYAYFHSSKDNQRNIRLFSYISAANASIKAMHEYLIKNPDVEDIQILYSFITDLINFIHRSIMLVAHYNATHNKKYQRELDYIRQSPTYYSYYPYLKDLACYMNDLYMTYPKWVSESSFIELGRKLFSFIKIHNLTFSTEDLSDNFILKEV